MSQIKIYNTFLTPDKNAQVEDLWAYLGTLTPTYHTDKLQYQKIELDMVVKLPIPQEKRFDLGNYAEIKQDGRTWYFFIMSAQWANKKTVAISLSLDTINTFSNLAILDDKTAIQREHKNRLIKTNKQGRYLKRIWPLSENVKTEMLTNNRPESLYDQHGFNSDIDWYLIYKTRDDLAEDPNDKKNPVSCFLIANQPLTIASGEAGGPERIVYPSEFSEGTYYYITIQDNPNFTMKFPKGYTGDFTTWFQANKIDKDALSLTYQHTDDEGISFDVIGGLFYGAMITREGDKLRLDFQPQYVKESHYSINNIPTVISQRITTTQLKLNNVAFIRYTQEKCCVADSIRLAQNKRFVNIGTGKDRVDLISLDQIDRSDSRTMKIIRLPYPPAGIKKQNDILVYDENLWEYKQGMLKVRDGRLSADFTNPNVINYAFPEMIYEHQVNPFDFRDKEAESKLLHSDYNDIKFVYDTFSYPVKLENFDFWSKSRPDGEFVPNLNISFRPTNTVNSKLGFHFKWNMYRGAYDASTYDTDYGDYLLASRNNEETIFNNDYINYIRNGYNYDVKAQDWSQKQQGWNIAIQALGTVASWIPVGAGKLAQSGIAAANNALLAKGKEKNEMRLAYFGAREAAEGGLSKGNQHARRIAQGNLNRADILAQQQAFNAAGTKYIPIAQGISMAAGLANSVVNKIFSQLQFENSMKQKLAMLASQATTTSGTDDSDLLKWYNNNKLQVIRYKPREAQSNLLNDLFFYTGYSAPSQSTPDLNTRYWFNFIQCEPVFKNEAQLSYQEFLTDIKARYNAGLTIYHRHEEIASEVARQWDLEQERENWETSILDTSKMPKRAKPNIVWYNYTANWGQHTLSTELPHGIEEIPTLWEPEVQMQEPSTFEWVKVKVNVVGKQIIWAMGPDLNRTYRWRIRMNDIARPEFTSDWVELQEA